MQPRYDEKRQIYRDCRFCGGQGCLACQEEAEKAYRREFPGGPKPITVFKKDRPEDMEKLKQFINSITHGGGNENHNSR